MADKFSVRLCVLVQQNPELYDVLNERFHDQEAKKSAWRKIAWCLEVPPWRTFQQAMREAETESECEIKWKKIRHQYVKAKKEENTKWDLWPYLRFLEEAEARSIPGKSPKKRKASTKPADTTGTPSKSPKEEKAGSKIVDSTGISGKSFWKGRLSEAETVTVDSSRFPSLSDDTVFILTRSALDKAIYGKPVPSTTASLKDMFPEKYASSSEAAEPPCKRQRTEGSGSQVSQATECGAVLDQRFLRQLEEKFTKLRPEVSWTMKANILKMLDEAAKR